MAAKNQKSSTLPPDLRYGVKSPPPEENEGFFSKFKKKIFKPKKGKYTVETNTGECDNIAAVSFRKRESKEFGNDIQWKLKDTEDFQRETRSHSPKPSKQALRTQSDRIQSHKPGKSKHERKHSFPESTILALRNTPMHSKNPEPSGTKQRVGNEYCRLDYENRDINQERPRLSKGNTITNEHLVEDDNGIDLDKVVPPQYDPNYVTDIRLGLRPGQQGRFGSNPSVSDSQKSPDWDPNYESLNDVKQKLLSQFSEPRNSNHDTDSGDFDPNYQSVAETKGQNMALDPGYQSVNEVKRQASKDQAQPKRYNRNQSIESLDEPGYECLNDVKKRALEQNREKSKSKESVCSLSNNKQYQDKKLSLENLAGSRPSERRHSGTPDSGSGIHGLTEIAVSLTGIATALTGSGMSKDSGFQSKDRSVDSEMEENLCNSVKKSISTSSVEGLYSSIKKDRAKSVSELEMVQDLDPTGPGAKTQSNQNVADGHQKATKGEKAVSNEVISPTKVAPVYKPPLPTNDDYDSDMELILDPGYAECADAIKVPPCSIYSEGSGSKISSCTSLDLSAEDFILEPGYAECADAIKTGAIKKVSVSHERLVDITKHDSSEIYANPQILFRKRSKLIDDGSTEVHDTTDDPGGLKEEKSKDKKKKTKIKPEPVEAPPLPARNYSLYLENEEAEKVVKEVLDDIAQEKDGEVITEDDAFGETGDREKESVKTKKVDKNKTVEGGKDTVKVKEVNVGQSDDHLEDLSNKENLTKGVDDSVNIEKSDKVETEKGESKCKECEVEKCKETNADDASKVNDEIGEKGKEDECFHVTVRDKSGNEKVLRIVEKEESFKIKDKRRESCRKLQEAKDQSCDKDDKDSDNVKANDKAGSEVKDTQNETNDAKDSKVDVTNTNILNTKTDSHAGIQGETHEFKELTNEISVFTNNFTNTDSTKDTKDIDNSVTGLGAISCEKGTGNCEANEYSIEALRTNVPHINTEIEVLENFDILHHTENCPNTGCEDSCNSCGLEQLLPSCTYQANSQKAVDLYSKDLLTVNVVKMKSISTDSENSDFPDFLDLPKLEICESDLENPFDSSDNSNGSVNGLDLASESATIEKLTNDLTNDIMESVLGKDGKVDKVRETADEVNNVKDMEVVEEIELKSDEVCVQDSDKVTDSDVDKYDETKEKRSVKEVLDTESEKICSGSISEATEASMNSIEVEEKVTEGEQRTNFESVSRENVLSDLVRPENSEVSDDSAIETDDKDDEKDRHDSNVTVKGCESVSPDSSIRTLIEAGSNSNSTNENTVREGFDQMTGSVEERFPGIYDDNEPTHMTIKEVMDRSPGFTTVYRAKSPISGEAAFNLSHTHSPSSPIENIPQSNSSDSPPPRPPPVNSGQSRNKNSNSSQSSVGTADTPPEDSPPPFRFAYGSGQSDEEAPPAVPPRIRERKSNKRPVSYSQDFMESMRQLKDCGWYWGPLSWEEAEIKLNNKPEGAFLVRDSSDQRYILSLSFKNQHRVHHTRIEHHKGHFSFWSQPESHGKSTIKDFIEQCVENSRNGRFLYFIRPSGPGSPPMPIHLLHPVSRFIQMQSLQHMCRFRILQMVRRDHIDHLPMPTRMKQYLKEAQYYVECLDD